MEQSTFQPGDICLECQLNGLSHKLRSFYIDIDEQIVKCESSTCLYPYENDFSESEDENKTEEAQICAAKTNSLPDLEVITFDNECDDADSVRFVEALLGKSNNNEVMKTDLIQNTKQCLSESLDHAITLEKNTESTLTLVDSLQRNDTVQTEGVGFIDALFNNCENETKEFCDLNTLKVEPTLPATAPTFDMPIITFDFSNTPAIVEQMSLTEVKKENKPQIEIQCIQTVNADFASATHEDNITCMPKVSIKSLELIKTEYVKEEPVVQPTSKLPSEQKDNANSNGGDNKVRISRYFDTLRFKQGMLQKTFTKPTATKGKKRTNKQQQQIPKAENTAGSSLVNVLAVLRNKTQN
uniref:Fibrocystin-L n=1 Tax=Zeugodacus cucurbitae TaxID=28588 RepID=A0A0A1WZ75_ZEUCU